MIGMAVEFPSMNICNLLHEHVHCSSFNTSLSIAAKKSLKLTFEAN